VHAGRVRCAISFCAFVLLLGACGIVHRAVDSNFDAALNDLTHRLTTSRLTLTDTGFPDTSATHLAGIANGPYGNPAVLAADGDVNHGGVHLVVRIDETDEKFGGTQVKVTRCYKFTVSHPWFAVGHSRTKCPATPPISLPPTPTTRPDLGNLVDAVTFSIKALPAGARDVASVQQAVTQAVAGSDATVATDEDGGVVGVTITRKIDCVMARVGNDVEVWRPASVSRTYGVPGELECSPAAAILRREQLPPH
jgi:hypothetical protein